MLTGKDSWFPMEGRTGTLGKCFFRLSATTFFQRDTFFVLLGENFEFFHPGSGDVFLKGKFGQSIKESNLLLGKVNEDL